MVDINTKTASFLTLIHTNGASPEESNSAILDDT